MGNYKKLIGSVVGGAAGLLVSVFGLSPEWQDPEIVAAITTLAAALATFVFPKNEEPSA